MGPKSTSSLEAIAEKGARGHHYRIGNVLDGGLLVPLLLKEPECCLFNGGLSQAFLAFAQTHWLRFVVW